MKLIAIEHDENVNKYNNRYNTLHLINHSISFGHRIGDPLVSRHPDRRSLPCESHRLNIIYQNNPSYQYHPLGSGGY